MTPPVASSALKYLCGATLQCNAVLPGAPLRKHLPHAALRRDRSTTLAHVRAAVPGRPARRRDQRRSAPRVDNEILGSAVACPVQVEHVLILCMDYGLVLFTSDRGISPAAAAKLADDHGFHTFYVPEHTHIPVKREAAHPTTGDASLPDDRYMRTLDPWVSLGAACAVTSRVRLSTAVALPVEHDPITLAKSIATLDHLSGGRVSVGVGFGWNTDELADHGVPPGRRRTMLREYLEAMRALWTQEEAAYDGEFVRF